MKTYRIIIANEASNYTSTKYNNTLNGFTSEEAASKAAKQALRDAAGELMKWDAICYIETLNTWVLANNGNWLLVAKIEATETEQPETKQLTVKRSDWNETAKRLECAGWYYIGTPTATGKTIYRRDNSELKIIIEEEPTDNTPTTMNANETTANDIRESISRLRYELQQYHNNASKGGTERRRNMILLRWDIRRLERQLKAMKAETRTKSMNAKSAKDLERQIARISGARFDKALEIYSRYLHNIAVYFSGDKYPLAPAMTPEQLKIKVPRSIYAAK